MTADPYHPRNWPAETRFDAGACVLKWLLEETATSAGGLMAKVNGLRDEFDRLERIVQDARIEAAWCQNEDF